MAQNCSINGQSKNTAASGLQNRLEIALWPGQPTRDDDGKQVFSDRHAGRSDFCCPRAIFIIDKPCRIGSLCGNRQREVFRLLVGYIRFGRSWTSLSWRPDGSCTQCVGNDRRNGRPANWSSSHFVCLCYNFGPFVSSGLLHPFADLVQRELGGCQLL